MINLKNTEIGYRFFNFKEYSCFYCFDNLTFGAFKKFCKCLNEIEQSSVEISLPKNVSKEKVEKNLGFTFQNKWYKSKVKKNIDTTFNKNVFLIEDRKQIADLIKSKQLECANRKPEKFDKNKQDENWIEFGKEALALKLDGKILSILTFTEEENKNLRLRLIYTIKNYQRHGFGAVLVEHAFKIAKLRNLQTVTACVDNSEGEHIEHLLENYKFKHIRNGYVKILK